MTKKSVLQSVKAYLLLTVGAAIYSCGITLFLDPNKLAPGGISGISVIISHVTGGMLSTGILILLLNTPLLLLAFFKLGKKLAIRTLYMLGMIAVFDKVLAAFTAGEALIEGDMFINAAVGAALMSVGIGLAFRNGATTGGTDIVIKFLRLKYKYIKTGTFFLMIDAVVVAASGIVFGDLRVAFYAGLVVLIQSTLLDLVLYGSDGAALVFIISTNDRKISERLLNDIDCGITLLDGKGAYSGIGKQVLLTAVHKQSLPKVREIVRDEDERAFMIISSASTVLGEGFRSHKEEDL